MSARTTRKTCLFLDIGGVLLSDGWDRGARKRAAARFRLDRSVFEERHHVAFGTYEEGRLTLDEYLDLAVFHQSRAFSRATFQRFMFEQSTPHLEMLALLRELRAAHGLRVVIVSNEGRELNEYRVRKFGLDDLVDVFVSSSFVHCRKPDPRMFSLALDIAHVPADRVVYIDDNPVFIHQAAGLGIAGICHTDAASTRTTLASLGLSAGPGRGRHRAGSARRSPNA